MLHRGIGIHHAGLLPILKEVVEILFGEGLIKVLVATETFAMGVNFPAKTVIFSNVRKWDGSQRRLLTSGEYVQMSGRAGRRGLDARGIVIMCVDENLEPTEVTRMLRGQADRLVSEFRLTYPMIIQLTRIEDVKASYLIQRSFMHFQTLEKTPQIIRSIQVLEQEEKEIVSRFFSANPDSSDDAKHRGIDLQKMTEFYELNRAWKDLSEEFRQELCKPKHLLRWLNPGRLVFVSQTRTNQKIWGWGICLNFKKLNDSQVQGKIQKYFIKQILQHGDETLKIEYVVDVLLPCRKDTPSDESHAPLMPIDSSDWCRFIVNPNDCSDATISFRIIPVQLHHIERVSIARVNLLASLHLQKQRQVMGVRLFQSVKKLASTANSKVWANPNVSALDNEKLQDEYYHIPCLHPVTDMKISSTKMKTLADKMDHLKACMRGHDVYTQLQSSAEMKEYMKNFERKKAIEQEVSKLQGELHALENNEHISLRLKGMNRVLRRLQLVDNKQHVVTVKGRIACEISCADELVLTELLFGNIFAEMKSAAHVNALLSCFVFDEKNNTADDASANEDLEKSYRQLREKIRQIAEICIESKLDINPKKYEEEFSKTLMEVCYAWTNGSKFGDIMKMTKVYEGSIVRVIRRLHELLDELVNCSHLMGNEKLVQLFDQCQNSLKRDIIFASSLYL
ncbi:RNA helicase [Reticulomyxa filosa]|uniref:RNA helicase n=1 Tax=Reticulomyxa filosa TaxID=46433 RepID=X6M781_RETFI|nr:RNA helicase [Reticulomyxa filosa]|eukprot:ETO09327.1 RNA helicase [Reticulomyxa filosa]